MIYHYFKEDDLKPLIKEGTLSFPNTHQWGMKTLKTMRDVVIKNPIMYRSFGMYWWAIKSIMIEEGLLDKQYTVDKEVVNEVKMTKDIFSIAAALAFHQQSLDNQSSKNNMSTVFNENGESVDYMLLDDDLEMLIFINNQ